jgi:hypothetical protein
MRYLLAAALILITTTGFAQTEGVIELLRHDVQAEKMAIMTASLPMTEAEGNAFWPIYREYSAELAKLGDRRLAVIKKIAETSGKLDEKTVEAGVKESFSIESDRLSLWKKYHGKVAKAIGVVKAARFLQIESQLSKVIDAMLADQVPLLKMPPASPAGEPKK